MNKEDLKRMNGVLRHRLRNYASGIKSAISLLSTELENDLPPETMEYFPLIINECKSIEIMTVRMNHLFDDPPTGTLKSLAELLELLITKIHSSHPTAEIILSCDDASAATNIPNSEALDTAMNEVIVNAIESCNKNITVDCTTTAKKVQLTISDHGTPPDDCKIIFEPFYTKRSRHIGIGLTIAKRLINSMKGEIAAKNNGNGLTIEIVIPQATNKK